jgi:hypothetical protein
MCKKITYASLLLVGLLASVKISNAQVIIKDNFNISQDWYYDDSTIDTIRASKSLFNQLTSGTPQRFSAFDRNTRITSADGLNSRGVRTELYDNYAAWSGPGPHSALGVQVSGTMYADPVKQTGSAYWYGDTVYIAYRNRLSDNSNWQNYAGGVVNLKMTRIEMDNGGDVIPELDNGTYKIFIDGENAYYDIYKPDTNWHTYVWKMKGQSSPSVHDGYLSLHVDGVKVWEKYNVAWTGRVTGNITEGKNFRFGYDPATGWRHGWFFLGGNVSEGYKDDGRRYLYWDDYIVADTLADVDEFLGTITETGDNISPLTTPLVTGQDSSKILTLDCQDTESGCFRTYYTADGSMPTTSSAVYTSPITVNQTTTFKFFSVDNNSNTEPIRTQTVEIAPITNPTVKKIFEENFEDGDLSGRGWYDNTNVIISDTEHAPDGSKSGQYHFNAGSKLPSTGGGSLRRKIPDSDKSDTIYVSFWEKYSSNWRETAGGYGHHEIYLVTDADTYDYVGPAFTKLTGYIETWGTYNQNVNTTPTMSLQDGVNINYSYPLKTDLTNITEDRATSGCNGFSDTHTFLSCYDAGGGEYWNAKVIQENKGSFTPGSWHHVEALFKLNSIKDGKGVADGVMAYWLDGVQQFYYNDVMMRTAKNPDMKFNKLFVGPYLGYGAPVSQDMFIDNLQVWNGFPGVTEVSDTDLPITSASPASGVYGSSQLITLTCTDQTSGCANIYYTIDGSEPTENSSVYSSPIAINQNATLRFFAKDKAGNKEILKSQAYTIEQQETTYTLADIVNLMSDWRLQKASPADANKDNIVNARDLGIMMSNWQ